MELLALHRCRPEGTDPRSAATCRELCDPAECRAAEADAASGIADDTHIDNAKIAATLVAGLFSARHNRKKTTVNI